MPPRAPVTELSGSRIKSDSTATSERRPASRFVVDPKIVFCVFAAGNVFAALYAPIQDCDEVFNYWEPTHYLNHGYGLQTWEYSPEYSIRSWLYVSLHAVLGKVAYLVTLDKASEFYCVRTALALACAYCETTLLTTISHVLNPRIGIMFMIVMLTAPGMFHAAAAYLPSSFSMYANMLGASAFMDWRKGPSTATGIMWFGVGGIIGWPFATALVAPFLLEELGLAITANGVAGLLWRCIDGTVRCILVLVLQVAVEALFYHKLVVVPWNIVAYNVFSGSGKGPDIFGTEPADYYLRNLLLNFNIWVFLALAAWPVLALQYYLGKKGSSFGLLRSFIFATPFYTWLAIFSAQPHKEERFMYPAYPFLALNAAIALHMLLAWLGNPDPRTFVGKIPAKLKLLVVSIAVLLAINVGFLRTLGMVSAYRAPLSLFSSLQAQKGFGPGSALCMGKEWYRFPSSFFLPNGTHAKFIQSEFQGLLPGQFSETGVGSGLIPETWSIPEGMNDQNIADPGKYTNITECDFLVDSHFPSAEPSDLEPNYIQDTATWQRVHCERFLDVGSTGLIGRLIWIPDIPSLPEKYRRKWGEYCLLRRRRPS